MPDILKLARTAGEVFYHAETEEAYRRVSWGAVPGAFNTNIGPGDVLNIGGFSFSSACLLEDRQAPASTYWTACQYAIAMYKYKEYLGLGNTWIIPVTGECRIWYNIDPWNQCDPYKDSWWAPWVIRCLPNPTVMQVAVNGIIVRSLSRRSYYITGHSNPSWITPTTLSLSISIQVQAGDVLSLYSYDPHPTIQTWSGSLEEGQYVQVPNIAHIHTAVCPYNHNIQVPSE